MTAGIVCFARRELRYSLLEWIAGVHEREHPALHLDRTDASCAIAERPADDVEKLRFDVRIPIIFAVAHWVADRVIVGVIVALPFSGSGSIHGDREDEVGVVVVNAALLDRPRHLAHD